MKDFVLGLLVLTIPIIAKISPYLATGMYLIMVIIVMCSWIKKLREIKISLDVFDKINP